MKYIVDLPDAYTSESALFGDILSIPICLEGGKRYGVPTGIKLEPYTEPDKDEIRQMAHEEAWEFARRIICPSDCCEDSISAQTKEIFNKEGWETKGIFNDLSYQEAKAKYDAWKQKKEEIRIGDEVRCMDRVGIVVRIDSMDGGSNVIWEDGATAYIGIKDLTKTGRHFNEVESLMERMREQE